MGFLRPFPQHTLWAVLAAALLSAGLGARPAFAQLYAIQDLGTLGGGPSEPADINNSGQIVGRSAIQSGVEPPHSKEPPAE